MGDRKEIPFEMPILDLLTQSSHAFRRRPETELQALQEAPAFYEPRESWEGKRDIINAVIEAIEELEEPYLEIINAAMYERATLREIGKRLGMSATHAMRLRNEAFGILKQKLEQNPVIKERLDIEQRARDME